MYLDDFEKSSAYVFKYMCYWDRAVRFPFNYFDFDKGSL